MTVAKQQLEPQRLLFVFLTASLAEDNNEEQANRFHSGRGGELQAIMSVDKNLDELGSFADLVEESRQMEQDWQIVLVAALSGRNGFFPSTAEAEQPLKVMLQTIESGGDLSKYLAFDRTGTMIHFS